MMDIEQLALWRYLIVLAKDAKIKYISLGSKTRRDVLIAVDTELNRLYEENKELQKQVETFERQLAGLKAAADCLGGKSDA